MERRGFDTSNLLTLDSYSDDGNSASIGHDEIYPNTDEDSSLQTNGTFTFVSDRSAGSSVVRNLFPDDGQQQEEGGLWYNSDTDTDGDNDEGGEDFLVDNMAMLSALGENDSDIVYPSVASDSIGDHSADNTAQNQKQKQEQPLGYDDDAGMNYDYSTAQNDEEGNEEEDEQGRRPSYLPGMVSSGFGESVEV